MFEFGFIISVIIVCVVSILITRLLGAWMLRINDVISEQREFKSMVQSRMHDVLNEQKETNRLLKNILTKDSD